MTLRPVGPNPSVHVRPATDHDVGFLLDVVLVTARAQGRVAEDFDEPAWRTASAAATLRQVHGEVPHDSTYVIVIGGARAGRMRLVQAPGFRELTGLQLLPAHQANGLGTHLVEQFLVDAGEQRAARSRSSACWAICPQVTRVLRGPRASRRRRRGADALADGVLRHGSGAAYRPP